VVDEADLKYVWGVVRKVLDMCNYTNLTYVISSEADGSYTARITFRDVHNAATWARLVTDPNLDMPDILGPVQFRDVWITTPVRSFDEPVEVSARLTPEWIEWVLSERGNGDLLSQD
jgi:hypothetical protein